MNPSSPPQTPKAALVPSPQLLSVTRVSQKTCYHCFPACLESFLRDNGVAITQDEIVVRCPAIFDKGGKEEGSFKVMNLGIIAQEFKIDIVPVSAALSVITHPKEAILMFCFWDGEESWKHWVRLVGLDSDKLYFMDPNNTVYPCERRISDVITWVRLPFKFSKV
jgi:ABC-type bacteriocin/lantibiotic exporter with double-glycine peptidase domain